MTRQVQVLMRVLLAGAVCCLTQTPGAGAEADIVIKAKVTLLDGSQFFGTPRFSSVALVMDFGKLDIPLGKVASLNFFKEKSRVGAYNIVKDSVKVGFANKDILSGKLDGATLEFNTIFNDVRLELQQIKSIAFFKQRDIARAASDPGLLLYAPLDMEQSDLSVFGVCMEAQKARVVEGHLGDALLLDSADARITLHLPFSPYTMPEGTIEFWAKLPQPRQHFSGGKGQPWFFSVETSGGRSNNQFFFGFAGSDTTGKAGLVGRIYGLAAAGTHTAGAVSNIAETGLLRDTPDGWHHYAIIWKADGVDFPDARGKALVLTVDGRIVAVADKDNNGTLTARQAGTDDFRLVIHDGNSDCTRPVAMSDLKIWSHAKQPKPPEEE